MKQYQVHSTYRGSRKFAADTFSVDEHGALTLTDSSGIVAMFAHDAWLSVEREDLQEAQDWARAQLQMGPGERGKDWMAA